MDETNPRHTRPSIGRRLLGRQAAVTRGSGLRLGRAVTGRHERPEPIRAAMRLVPKQAAIARAPAGPAAPAPAAASSGEGWVPSPTESTITPGISDWGAEWLFGDADVAVATGAPFMGGAGIAPPTPEEKRVARMKRGGPEVARAAKILEGDERPPARFPAEPPSSTPVPESASGKRPVRVSRTPAAPPASTPAGSDGPQIPRTEGAASPDRPTIARTVTPEGAPASPEPTSSEPPTTVSSDRPTIARRV